MRIRSFGLSFKIFVSALAILAGLAGKGEAAGSFFAGKILTIVVGGEAGASYDLYARLIAEFLPNYIPDHPNVIVEDMPGANGGVSAAYMFNKAPADGTLIAECVSNLPTIPLLHPEIAKFDATKFSWIGSVTKDIYVGFVWHTAPIETYQQAKETPVIMGGVLAGAASVQLAIVSNALFGTKFKIVPGYGTENKIELAMERGEVQGSFGGVYSTIKTDHSDWLKDGTIRIIMQHGLEPLPELADVPLFIDQAKNADDRQMLQFLLGPQEFNKPFYAPPGVPPDRLDILRRAFDGAVRDPGFLAAAGKAHLSVNDPMNGEQLTAAVSAIASTPQPLVDRLKSIFANFAQQ
jgi:tripartite-type tricarboxylate transporter receptor subunit TctC